MFQVSDLINKHEFVAKLNKIFSFDGKYSSLTDIPTTFPPEEHSHNIATTKDGFVETNRLIKFFDVITKKEDRSNSFSSDFRQITSRLQSIIKKNNWDSLYPDITSITAADFSHLLQSKFQYETSDIFVEQGEIVTVYPYTHNIINISPSGPLGIGLLTSSVNLKIDFSAEQIRNNIAKIQSLDRDCRDRASSYIYSVTPLVIPITFSFDIMSNTSYQLNLNPQLIIGNNIAKNEFFFRAFFGRCDSNVGTGIIEDEFIPPVYVSKPHFLIDGGYTIVQPYDQGQETDVSSILLKVEPNTIFYPEPHYPNCILRCRRITINGTLVIRKNIGANDDIVKIIPVAEFIVHKVS